MAPKEKAKELIDKYWTLIAYKIEGSVGRLVIKQCALIAVDEMISYFQKETFMMAYPEIAISEAAYWQEVKKEIELL